jgi:hypothetical protein
VAHESSCAAIHVHNGGPDQPVIAFILQAGEEGTNGFGTSASPVHAFHEKWWFDVDATLERQDFYFPVPKHVYLRADNSPVCIIFTTK